MKLRSLQLSHKELEKVEEIMMQSLDTTPFGIEFAERAKKEDTQSKYETYLKEKESEFNNRQNRKVFF